ERLKDAFDLRRRYARSGIAYAEADVVPLLIETQPDLTGIGELHGVAEEIYEDLPEFPPVGPHDFRKVLGRNAEFQTFHGGLRADHGSSLVGDSEGRDTFDVYLLPPRLGA